MRERGKTRWTVERNVGSETRSARRDPIERFRTGWTRSAARLRSAADGVRSASRRARTEERKTYSCSGRSTNSRSCNEACGTLSHHRPSSFSSSVFAAWSCSFRESNATSPYSSKSRSITRGPLRNVPKSRPRSRSTAFRTARSRSGDRVVSICSNPRHQSMSREAFGRIGSTGRNEKLPVDVP